MDTTIQNLKNELGSAVQDYVNEEGAPHYEDAILTILTNEEMHEEDIKHVLSDVFVTLINHNMPGYSPDTGPSCIYASPDKYTEEIREALLDEVTHLVEDDEDVTEEQYNEIVSEVKAMTENDLNDSFTFYLPNNYVIEFKKTSALEVLNECDVEWASTAIENQCEIQKP